MSTNPLINGHQNQVIINQFANPFHTINGRPATAEDAFNMLAGSLESAERELRVKDELISMKEAQINLQNAQISLQNEGIKHLKLEIARLKKINKGLRALIN